MLLSLSIRVVSLFVCFFVCLRQSCYVVQVSLKLMATLLPLFPELSHPTTSFEMFPATHKDRIQTLHLVLPKLTTYF